MPFQEHQASTLGDLAASGSLPLSLLQLEWHVDKPSIVRQCEVLPLSMSFISPSRLPKCSSRCMCSCTSGYYWVSRASYQRADNH